MTPKPRLYFLSAPGVASASYASGYADGEASVDITSDNAELASASYPSGYADGAASVDITSDNQAQYDQGYADGQGSVDITADNSTVCENADRALANNSFSHD